MKLNCFIFIPIIILLLIILIIATPSQYPTQSIATHVPIPTHEPHHVINKVSS